MKPNPPESPELDPTPAAIADPPTAPTGANLEPMAELSRQLAMELMFAEPGKDSGLLPLNHLLLQFEAWCQARPVPPEISQSLVFARQTVDRVLDSTALFDASSLARLREWNVWLQAALEASLRGQALPALPTTWTAPATSAAPTLTPAAAPVAQPKAAADATPSRSADLGEEAPLVLSIEPDADLLREFVTESQEHLQNIELGVLVLEENPVDADTLNSIFRAFHTFKGGSGFLRLLPVNRLAHELESLLDLARQHKLSITSPIINVILEGADCLKQFVAEIQGALAAGRAEPIVIPINALVARVKAIVTAPDGVPAPPPAAPQLAPAVPAPATPALALPVSGTSAPAAVAPAVATAPSSASSPAAGKSAAHRTSGDGAVVKVDTHKLDSLMDLVGELVIAQSMVSQDEALKSLQSQRLNRNIAQLNGIAKELQKITMSLRMVPIRPTFQKMNRLVRDLAAKQGKQVELQTSGEETEIDRTITEELTDPLVHMIRNSMDHGIEKPDQRLAQSKRPQGTIWLRAYHEGGSIIVEVQDDGAGLNKERIQAKAREKGLVRPDEHLTDREIHDLIFAPGFSTADVVTDLSGRGVGMDVVRRNVEKMRGKISITSLPGQGTTFTIALPLTLAIIDGFIVGVGKERFILPTYCVRESFRPTRDMLSSVHERGEMVNVRGGLSPLLRMYDFFGIEAAATDPTQGILLLVEYDNERRCLLVDQLLGKQEVVIKSLGEIFKQSPALAGAAILGDGRVGLILDVASLVMKSNPALRQAA